MPQAPFALLRASINGGAASPGGLTVPASATVQVSADPSGTSGAFAYKYEIYGYPTGFAQPSGWSTDSAGVYFYSAGATPPVFTLPTIANWGKFMLRLTLNNGISPSPATNPPATLIDEGTALSMLSPNGLADVGAFESNQFSSTWVTPVQNGLRAIDTAVTAVSGANQKPPAKLLAASNIASLSGEQTIDGVLTSSSRVLLVAQATSSQNGLWLTASGAWSRPVDFASDAQVIVGQTIFITSGSINTGTNWQLTSGSTIAGAKSYAQLVGGGGSLSVIQPVDAVATSNSALSGTTAIDGVTLTANVSRVVAVGQSTDSQNGPWLVQSGAWTRPVDFTVDAQVIAGQSVYVKSGALGAGTNWQLKSGSTIAGSKTFKLLPSGKGLSPIRLVQTAALPAGTYSAGVWTATSNGALSLTVFDGLSAALNNRVEISTVGGGITAPNFGLYSCTVVGDSSHAAQFTRVAELNSTATFVGGASYEVLDGAVGSIFKGTRRQLTTIGVVTLDTTPLAFGPVFSPEANFVDLRKQYGVKGAQTVVGAQSFLTNYSSTISAAAWAAHIAYLVNKVPQILRLPAGLIPTDDPVLFFEGVSYEGCSDLGSSLYPSVNAGGPAFWSEISPAALLYTAAADGGAHSGISLVDTTFGTGTAVRLADTTVLVNGVPTLTSVSLNLQLAGLQFAPEGGNLDFHWASTFLAYDVSGGNGFIDSTRGRLHDDAPLREMFSCFLAADGSARAKLRVTHPTTMVATGTGPAITVSTGTIPLGRIVHIEPDSVGNTAMASTTFRIRVDDGAWLGEFMVPSGGGLLPAAGAYPAGHILAGVQFTAAAGTYHGPSAKYGAPADSYENCKTATLTTGTGVVINSNRYSAEVTYSSSTGDVNFYVNCNMLGTAAIGTVGTTTVSSAAFFAGGHIQAIATETAVAGGGQNSEYPAFAVSDNNSPRLYLGGVRYSTVIRALMGTSITGLVQSHDAHELLWFVPGAWNTFTGPDGVVYGWYATLPNQKQTIVMKQRAGGAGGFATTIGAHNVGVYQSDSRRAGFYLASGLTNSKFHAFGVSGGSCGFTIAGDAFLNDFSGGRVGIANDQSYNYAGVNGGGFECSGAMFSLGHGSGILLNRSAIISPYVFINPESAHAPCSFSSQFDNGSIVTELIVDGENVASGIHPMVSISVSSGFVCDLSGSVNAANDRTALGFGSQNASAQGRLRWNMRTGAPNSDYMVEIYDSSVTPIVGGPQTTFPAIASAATICDRPGFFWPYNGARPATPLLAATTSIAFDPNEPYTVYEMAASTTTGAQSIALAVTGGAGGPREGHKIRVRIRAQGNNVTLTNAGGLGGTLVTVTAGQTFAGDFETPDGLNWFTN